MQCKHCGHTKSKVATTEKFTTEIVRVRKCVNCGSYYKTVECMDDMTTPRSNYIAKQQTKMWDKVQ